MHPQKIGGDCIEAPNVPTPLSQRSPNATSRLQGTNPFHKRGPSGVAEAEFGRRDRD